MTLKEAQHGGFPNSESPIVGSRKKSSKKSQRKTKKDIIDSTCIPEPEVVTSTQSAIQPQQNTEHTMILTLKGLDKRGRNAIYTGAAVSLRFPIGAFTDKTAPASLGVEGPIALKVAKTPRATMTAEERKAARAAQPKLTLAEKVAKAEERLAKQRAKLAEVSAEQPAL